MSATTLKTPARPVGEPSTSSKSRPYKNKYWKPPAAKICVGCYVKWNMEACKDSCPVWQISRVTSVNANGTYDVDYYDGIDDDAFSVTLLGSQIESVTCKKPSAATTHHHAKV